MNDTPNSFSLDLFRKWVKKDMQIYFTKEDVRGAQIVEVNSLGEKKKRERAPFSLVLRTSMKEAYYEQGTFKVVFPDKREEYLFMVPIGFDSDTQFMEYEVVYN